MKLYNECNDCPELVSQAGCLLGYGIKYHGMKKVGGINRKRVYDIRPEKPCTRKPRIDEDAIIEDLKEREII